jgi:hypothetical protein
MKQQEMKMKINIAYLSLNICVVYCTLDWWHYTQKTKQEKKERKRFV